MADMKDYLDCRHLNLGPTGGTGEVFTTMTYLGFQGDDRAPDWVVHTHSGWTIKLSDLGKHNPSIGGQLQHHMASTAYGLFDHP